MTKIVNADGSTEQLNSGGSPPSAPAIAKLEAVSPAVQPPEGEAERLARLREERARVSLSVPQQKMKVPEIPGWHLHWVNDHQGKIERARRGGYVFVADEEVTLADFSFAGDSTKTGNQDMGSRVSMVVGVDEVGTPMRAYLMKLPQELWEIDQSLLQEKNDQIQGALRRGRIGTEGVEAADLPIVRTVEVSRRDVKIRPANPSDVKNSI